MKTRSRGRPPGKERWKTPHYAEGSKCVSLRLEPALARRLESLARRYGLSQNETVRTLIREGGA